ncbi:MAG: ATP-binding cassette domain-containing protein, partial [Desulfobacterales bacterium]|nr:ATP-binding cassette domain-containing protein [Desulfobacterales bacterium]
MLEVRNIDVFYGRIQALWDVSFEIRPGEIVSLLGSNGAGKSTAIRTIQGLIRPASGQIRFRGRGIHRVSPHRIVARGMSMVPEERHLFPYLTVLENLELGAFHKKARKKRAETLQWIYELFP